MRTNREPAPQARTARNAAWAAIMGAVIALPLAGCSFERTFCGTDAVSCDADAHYTWVAMAE